MDSLNVDGSTRYDIENSLLFPHLLENFLVFYLNNFLVFQKQYVYAVYWGVTTMTTVGLGDLLPANIYEVLALSLFMFISCGTFAYSFNAIGDILGDIN